MCGAILSVSNKGKVTDEKTFQLLSFHRYIHIHSHSFTSLYDEIAQYCLSQMNQLECREMITFLSKIKQRVCDPLIYFASGYETVVSCTILIPYKYI